jgi:hypothetical protein
MKTKLTLLITLLFCGIQLVAQHPLVGTWEMVSIKGTDADGTPFNWNTATLRITKIITPTHYMLMQHSVRNDSIIFSLAHAGPIQFEDKKYSHTSTIGSDAATIGSQFDYTWNVKDNQLIQAGTITGSDGKKSVIEELVYKRVSSPSTNSKNPIVGTWNQLSSDYTSFDGTKVSHTNPTVTRFYIYTPTHWMMIGHWDKKFQNAMGGTYTIQNDKIKPSISVASFAIDNSVKYDISYRMEGNKLHTNGSATSADGKKMTWSDVFQKVASK